MSATNVEVILKPGSDAPRYDKDKVTQLEVEKVIITEKGMDSGLPLLDFQLKDGFGRLHFFMISGRIVQAIAGAVNGVNIRNHGTAEPGVDADVH